jgi:hypothetical protein
MGIMGAPTPAPAPRAAPAAPPAPSPSGNRAGDPTLPPVAAANGIEVVADSAWTSAALGIVLPGSEGESDGDPPDGLPSDGIP